MRMKALTAALMMALTLSALEERVAVAQALPDEAMKDHLAALGKRRVAELTTEVLVAIPWRGGGEPASPTATGGEVQLPGKGGMKHEVSTGAIPALGPLGSCARPTARERAALIKAVAAADPAMRADELSYVRFGCKEKGGIILDLTHEGDRYGTWKVLHASKPGAKARISVLASYRGIRSVDWMVGNNPVRLDTMALADLDGDGTRDALLAQRESEPLTPIERTTLSLWLSSKGKVVPLGTPDGLVAIAMQPWTPATHAAAAAPPRLIGASWPAPACSSAAPVD